MAVIGAKFESIDEYIRAQPKEVQPTLERLRQTIKKAAPEAEEAISYGMPTFKMRGPLAYFAAFKNHVGFFPTSTPIPVFKKDLAAYKTSKGTIQFPLDRPIPYGLVMKIVKFKVKELSGKGNSGYRRLRP